MSVFSPTDRLPLFWGVCQSGPSVINEASLDHHHHRSPPTFPSTTSPAQQGHSSSPSNRHHPSPPIHLSTFSPVLPHRAALRSSSLLGPSNSCSAIPTAYHTPADYTIGFNSPKHRTLDGHAPLRLTGHLTNVSTNQRPRNIDDCIRNNASVAMDTDTTLQRHHGPNSLDRNHRNGAILICSGVPTSCSGVPTSCSGVAASAHLDPRMPLISETSERSTGRQDDDVTTTTSGSYVIDADDLCDEIDELFFRDVRSVAA